MKRYLKYFPSLINTIIITIIIVVHNVYIREILFGLMLLSVIIEFLIYLFKTEGEVLIETPDGSNQPYHPSVLFFDKGWNGYKYWMSYTPFPINKKPYRDRWEYPCIAVSNDGLNWISNKEPLDDLTMTQIENKDYFSDTELVYNKERDCIECFYRLSEEKERALGEKGVWLFKKNTTNGRNWSERNVLIRPGDILPNANQKPCISPTIIRKEVYYMWYVVSEKQQYSVWFSKSKDGENWERGRKCELKGLNINPWHIDCEIIDGKMYLLVYDFTQRITLWESKDGIEFSYLRTMLQASHRIGSFYKTSLYRSCILKDNKGYKIYFSAGNDRKVKIGLMTGHSLDDMKVKSVSKKIKIMDFFIDYFLKYFFIEKYIIWRIKKLYDRKNKK